MPFLPPHATADKILRPLRQNRAWPGWDAAFTFASRGGAYYGQTAGATTSGETPAQNFNAYENDPEEMHDQPTRQEQAPLMDGLRTL